MVRNQWLSKRLTNKAPVLFVAAVLVLSFALAGCTGDDDVDPARSTGNGTSGGEGNGNGGPGEANGDDPLPAGKRVSYRFSHENLSAQRLTETGSFGPTEHCFPVNCFVGDEGSYSQRVNLDEIVPRGIPVLVEAELVVDAEYLYSMTGSFDVSQAVSNLTPAQLPWNHESLVVALAGDAATLDYVVQSNLPNEESELQWTVHVTATPIVDHVPRGFPVAFEVHDPTTAPTIRSTNFTSGSFMLWDGDDEYLGVHQTVDNLTNVFLEHGKTGEYVLFAPWDSVDLVLETNSSLPASMRALGITESLGTFQAATANAPAEWTFDVESVPLAVGFASRGTQMMNLEFESAVSLESDAGMILEGDLCGFCINSDQDRLMYVQGTHTAVIAGTYSASYQDSGYGWEIADMVWTYER